MIRRRSPQPGGSKQPSSSQAAKKAAASSTSSSSSSSSKAPADLITLRMGDDLVYVPPSADFEDLVAHAQEQFPALAAHPRGRIAFSLNVRVNGEPRRVRIAGAAWPRLVATLGRFEILDVFVLPPSAAAAAVRPSKSETDVHATYTSSPSSPSSSSLSSSTTLADEGEKDAPPRYFSLGADGSLDGGDKKGWAEEFQELLAPPRLTVTAPQMTRPRSAIGWLGNKLR